MIRTCDGTDPNLLDDSVTARPCACGLTFDDVERSVIHPHVYIPTPEEKAELLAAAEDVYRDHPVFARTGG
jgi:hypothetical protein